MKMSFFTVALAGFIVWASLVLSVLYVLAHFIEKFW